MTIRWRNAFVFSLPYCRACFVDGERGAAGRIGQQAARLRMVGTPAFWRQVRRIGRAHYRDKHPDMNAKIDWERM